MTADDAAGRLRRWGYFGLAVADASLAWAGATRARWLTKPALMPVLMVGRDRPTQRALALGGAGDIALLVPTTPAFTVGLSCFLAGHLSWVAALRGRPGQAKVVARHPWVVVPYAATWAGLNAYLWPRTGSLRIPVLAYSAALGGMAVVALDTGQTRASIGGSLFMLSDSLLALKRFGGLSFPLQEAAVMATYTTAQYLLAGD